MNTKTMETGTELAIAPSRDLEAAFGSAETVDGIVAKITKAAKEQAAEFDTTTPKGRAAIKSIAHTVAKSKTALDAKGKDLNDERRAAINVVDAGRRKIREKLDNLRDEIRKPVTEWENAEEERTDALKARLAEISVGHITAESSADNIEGYIGVIKKIGIDDTWQEYKGDAAVVRFNVLECLENYLHFAAKREAMEKELEERREADAERDRLDAYEAMQLQAEADNKAFDQAVVDAEIKRAEDAEAERRRIEQAAAAATKAAEDKAEADRLEAERKHQQELADAEEVRQAEKKKADDEQAARDKNKKLRDAAAKAIAGHIKGMNRDEVVAAIMVNEIPHVKLIL